MSNRRRPAPRNTYRTRYLASPAWHARRDRWFAAEAKEHGCVRCALCLAAGTPHTLELHHVDYRGVTQTPTGWAGREHHDDLIALHPRCHEWVHRLIDRDQVLAGLLSRKAATFQAIARLRAQLADTLRDAEDA